MRGYQRAGAAGRRSRGDHGPASRLTRPEAALAVQRMAGNRAVAALAPRMLSRQLVKDPKTGEYYDDKDPTQRRFATAGEAIGYARAHGSYAPQSRGPVSGLPLNVVSQVLGYLDPEDVLAVRETNRSGLGAVEAATLAAGPPRDEADLILGNPYHFPTEFRSQGVTNSTPVTGSQAVHGGWMVYDQVDERAGPAYVEVKIPKPGAQFPKKDDLFPRNSPQERSARGAKEKQGRLFSPPKLTSGGKRTWTAQINDTWVLGIIHKKLSVRFLADLTEANLWDGANNRPTALGREITQLYHAGYTCQAPAAKPTKDDPYAHVGVLLVPPAVAAAECAAPVRRALQPARDRQEVREGRETDLEALPLSRAPAARAEMLVRCDASRSSSPSPPRCSPRRRARRPSASSATTSRAGSRGSTSGW
jgi:hypothetical protein